MIKNKDKAYLFGNFFLNLFYNNSYYRPDGKKYVGEWYDGKQNGRGVYIYPNGQRREGEWKHGRRLKWENNDTSDDRERPVY